MMIIQNILRRLDYLGIGLSLFCAVHCALLPLIITFLSLFGLGFLANEHWETGIIAVLFLVGCYSLIDGYKQTKLLAPLAVLTLGFAFIFSAQFLQIIAMSGY